MFKEIKENEMIKGENYLCSYTQKVGRYAGQTVFETVTIGDDGTTLCVYSSEGDSDEWAVFYSWLAGYQPNDITFWEKV